MQILENWPIIFQDLPTEPTLYSLYKLYTLVSFQTHMSFPLGQSTCGSERKREGRLPGQNSCEIQYFHRLQWDPYQPRKANTGRPLLKYLERNICKLCKCLPHKSIHTHHFPQTSPSSTAQHSSHSVPNKSRQFPFIPPQNKQDALSKLQLSWKDHTNCPPPYAGMQLMV
jgi:hypothetical protein